uniref:Uncharacterized protein n=1 Tax=Anguilla anguilla TaxID=7936 RepID=A0A0E9WTN8_ANGAN
MFQGYFFSFLIVASHSLCQCLLHSIVCVSVRFGRTCFSQSCRAK